MQPTPIQRRIERTVASGDHFDRRNTRNRFRAYNGDSEVALQVELGNMDTGDGKLSIDEVISFSPQLTRMVNKFYAAGIPLETITDASGFDRAFTHTYSQAEEAVLPNAVPERTLLKYELQPLKTV